MGAVLLGRDGCGVRGGEWRGIFVGSRGGRAGTGTGAGKGSVGRWSGSRKLCRPYCFLTALNNASALQVGGTNKISLVRNTLKGNIHGVRERGVGRMDNQKITHRGKVYPWWKVECAGGEILKCL